MRGAKLVEVLHVSIGIGQESTAAARDARKVRRKSAGGENYLPTGSTQTSTSFGAPSVITGTRSVLM